MRTFNESFVGKDATLCIEPIKLVFKKGEVDIKTRTIPKWGTYSEFNGIIPLMKQQDLIVRGQNWVCIVTGRPRSGKSWSSLTLAKAIDPNFNINQVVFSAEEFVKLIESAETNDNLKDGSIILWDEAGVGIGSRNWYSVLNKCINLILQTWGYKHFGLILTVPHLSFIDAQTRRLINTHVYTQQRINTTGIVRAKIQDTTPVKIKNQDVIKSVTPRIKINNIKFAFYFIEIRKPPVILRHQYEIKKRDFTKALEKDTLAEITKVKADAYKVENKLRSEEEIVEELYPNLIDKVRVNKTGFADIHLQQIKTVCGVNLERAKVIRDLVLDRYNQEHPTVFEDAQERKKYKPKIIPL